MSTDTGLRALTTGSRAAGQSAESVPVRSLLSSIAQRLASWQQKRESRRALLNMTDGELADIGVTRAEARKEAGRSFFWD